MSKKKGVVVDINDPRKAMKKAGWGGPKPDKAKRTKEDPTVKAIKKFLGW
jgi:hypothetical protein